MKKKQNKNLITWKKALKHFDRDRIKQMRIELGFDEYGFKNSKEFEDWKIKSKYFIDDKNLTDEEIENTIGYKTVVMIHEISCMSPYVKSGFANAIREYLFFDEVGDDSIISANSTGCSLELIVNDDTKIKKGLYIKVGNQSSISDISEFIKNNKSYIREYLQMFRKKTGIKKIPTPKEEDFDRNYLIYNLYFSPIGFLQKVAVKIGASMEENISKRRDILGWVIMKKLGYDIELENFKIIAYREKKEREKYKKVTKK
jgi:hypothetical protein